MDSCHQKKDSPSQHKADKKPKKLGRPSVFSETVATKMVELAGKGHTDDQVAKIMGLHVNTIRNWRKKKESLMWAVKEAKAVADEAVEASLFHRALGYSHKAEKIFCNKDGDVTRAETVEHYPPDATSMIFWLKNRKPKEWRDRVEVETDSKHTFVLNTGKEIKKFPA